MTVKHSVHLHIAAAMVLFGCSLAIAEDNNTLSQPAGPISLTGLISAAPAPENQTASQSGEDNSSVSEQSTETLNDEILSESLISLTDMLAPDTGDEIGADGNESFSDLENRQPTMRIDRRSVSNIGLASIGLKQENAHPTLNSFIWKQSKVDTVLALLSSTPPFGTSQTLSRLSRHIILQPTVPPLNVNQSVSNLISARLDWLARAGRSDSLSALVRKLPDDEEWANWKRWQTQYDLIRRADDTACNDAARRSAETLESFWHKANIICLLLSGQNAPASFAADILNASGEDDDNFFQLVDKLLGRRTEISLDMNNLSLVHLMLMDAAHETITLDALDNLQKSMIGALREFRYLDADASLTMSYRLLERGLQSSDDTEQIWRSLSTAPVPAEAALSELDTAPLSTPGMRLADSPSSPFLWVALFTRSGPDTDMLVRFAIEAEARSGRLSVLMPLYNSLVRHRLDSGNISELDNATARLYAFVMLAYDPQQELPEALVDMSPDIGFLRSLFKSQKGDMWDAKIIEGLGIWHMLPLLEACGLARPDKDWLTGSLADTGLAPELTALYHNLPARRMLALDAAAAAGRVGETIMLLAHLVQHTHLGYIRPADGVIMIDALSAIGLEEAAANFGRELLIGQLQRHYQGQEN